MLQLLKNKYVPLFVLAAILFGFIFIPALPGLAQADVGCRDTTSVDCPRPAPDPQSINPYGSTNTADYCGGAGQEVHISFNIGCRHQGNPITDAIFAIIRFLSYGVGLVIVASLTFAGIQYTAARDDAKATAAARSRIYANMIALIIFIFGYALLNYIIPQGFFN